MTARSDGVRPPLQENTDHQVVQGDAGRDGVPSKLTVELDWQSQGEPLHLTQLTWSPPLSPPLALWSIF